jgi:hypothetical protein
MSVVINDTFSIFVNTATADLDDNVIVSDDKSRLTINLEAPLVFSSSSLMTTLEVEQASIWNTSYNISALKLNNLFYYRIAGVLQTVIIIPDGLYSVSTLNSEITRVLLNRGLSATDIQITGNLSTGRCIINVAIGYQVDMTQANTVRLIVGFDSGIYPVAIPIAPESITGQNTAKFNNTNSILITTNLVGNGIPINNTGAGLIASVPIQTAVGSLISYQPVNPIIVDANMLKGRSTQNFYIQLSDDQGVPLPQTEPFSVLLVFKQQILLSDSTVGLKNL